MVSVSMPSYVTTEGIAIKPVSVMQSTTVTFYSARIYCQLSVLLFHVSALTMEFLS